ncbi:MAG: V-type ATPase subunit [Clostridiales bacterium]|nr:V-type ATPase subunit [Clostridiales bacterium]
MRRFDETNYVFQATYAKILESKQTYSRDDVVGILQEVGADEALAVPRLDADFHNLKALIRGAISGEDVSGILDPNGNVSHDELRVMVEEKGMKAIADAFEAYAKTSNAKDIDDILDEEYFKRRKILERKTGDPLLKEILQTEREVFEAKKAQRLDEADDERVAEVQERLDGLLREAGQKLFGLAPIYGWWISCTK